MGKSLPRIRTLDGVRALAALLVMISHLPKLPQGQTLLVASPLNWAFSYNLLPAGTLAVYVFFCLSGFLITRILLAMKNDGSRLREFYARRSLRIFPVYYFTVLCCYVLIRRGSWVWYALTYTVNFHAYDTPMGHAWSLGIEEQFYLFWPPVVWYLSRENGSRVVIYGILIWVLGSLLEFYEHAEWIQSQDVFRPALFLAGAWLAFDESRLTASPVKTLLIGLTLIALGWFAPKMDTLHRIWRYQARQPLELLAVGILYATFAIDQLPNPITWLLQSRPLAAVAAISYGLYLYHIPINEILRIYDQGNPHIGWAFPITFAVAIASYFLLEQPLLKLGPKSRAKQALSLDTARSLSPAAVED